ncbi:ferritin-like domain-containing protein [Thioflexithrix psekupsensis]|uniref:Rhamnosyltransferase n=1 Tax=Thioflexithrix psekupsensis TaxID=1570016 RepID=A0A251XB34_9GAMM|nr:ferritin-like domain-containing protein [Thioflexithrix psekupsensis]OUD15286.1 hypothetical protein TPSD3_01790 [Thioflexithrix psekupsensis]
MDCSDLFSQAHRCLMSQTAHEKTYLTLLSAQAWQLNHLTLTPPPLPPQHIHQPGHPSTLQLVDPKTVPRRRLGTLHGQAALLHALAHIEFNAINLAWDAVYRFRDLPRAYYDDWVKVAYEEAFHFKLLQRQLQHFSLDYGDLPAHNGLWEMAIATETDPLLRMALVPRLLEARGLDATPSLIHRLKTQKNNALAAILDIILHDEIGHVAIGSRWFCYLCQQRGLPPESTFYQLLKKHFTGQLRPPFNHAARLAAGFSEAELAQLAHWERDKV